MSFRASMIWGFEKNIHFEMLQYSSNHLDHIAGNNLDIFLVAILI